MQNAKKNYEQYFVLNQNYHQTYQFGDDCMSGDQIIEKLKLLFGFKHQNKM